MTPLLHQIADLSIPKLASQFGTPLYVYDAKVIVERIGHLASFDVTRYAQKACSNIAILDLARRNNVVVDAVSAGEIHRALAAGYKPGFDDPPQIVYTADIFDRETLDMVVDLDIPVNCGSPDMISQYGERAPGKTITLRINPGFGHGHSQKTNTGGEQSKHGIWHQQIEECIERTAEHKVTIAGLHMHIGSGTDMEHLSQVSAAMERAALAVGSSITSISAGGGLPTPYRDGDDLVDIAAYFEQWDATRGRLAQQFGHHVSLEIEPGRYLAAESGYLIAEVRAVKQMGGNVYYLLDAGFNNLARPIMYGSYHPMSVCPANGDTERPDRQVVVGGPLCESGDIFTQEDGGFVSSRSLPDAKIGDFVVIGCAGAYGYTMSSNYNSKPLCAEVLIQDGQAQLIRERQSLEDLTRLERIP
ncbi:diaminopimelate decarboxylase [Aeoliella sp. SH292]|uniref:diaminopimelate decarboxylase n=1 Tax=Aeoliella sp. SH292 TaxID=3454464 RepID=UPI003F9D34B6